MRINKRHFNQAIVTRSNATWQSVTLMSKKTMHHRGHRDHRGKDFLVFSSLCPLCALWLKIHNDQLTRQTT